MAAVEWVYLGVIVGLLAALAASLVALRRATRGAREARSAAQLWEALALDPVRARLHRLDKELDQLLA